jgi:hypothetical protein
MNGRKHPGKAGCAHSMCALYALEISLEPIYRKREKTPPTFSTLHGVLKFAEYRLIAARKFCGLYLPDIKTPQEPYEKYFQQLKKEGVDKDTWGDSYKTSWNDLFDRKYLSSEAMEIILSIVSRQDDLRIGLGTVLH